MFVQSNIEIMNLKTFFTSLQRSNEREDYSSTKEYLLLKVFCLWDRLIRGIYRPKIRFGGV
jgi:hypothetical protein